MVSFQRLAYSRNRTGSVAFMTWFKKRVYSWIGSKGYRISKTTNLNHLRSFISLLHPIQVPLIRVGGNGDGGYLIPDDLSGVNFCFSPGVSDIATFENELSSKGVKSFLADYSVENPPFLDNSVSFIKKFVGPTESIEMIVFEDWIKSNVESGEDLILQMDIEGAEYQTLLSCNSSVLTQFRIMVIEFHSLNLLFDKDAFPIIKSCFDKILTHFSVVHIHPNNTSEIKTIADIQIPPILEITFLRKDRVNNLNWAQDFPHRLDFLNVPTKANLVLPRLWFNQDLGRID